MKSNVILAATWLSSNSTKVRNVVIIAMLALVLVAGFGVNHIAEAGPASGGSHGCSC